MELKRVVVTGLGTISPIGNSISEFEKNLFSGVSGASLITRFDTTKFKTKFACDVKNYNPLDYFDNRKEVRKLDLYAQFAIIAATEAVKDSNINLDTIDPDSVGVIWSSGIGGLQTFDDELGNYFTGDGTPRFSPFFIPKMIADIAAGHIAMKFNFRGPNYATVSACASSSHAILDAFNHIRLGKAKIMVSGGAEAPITKSGIGGFNAMHAISTRNDDYKTASRPFSADRDGFVMAEGGAGLILEEYEHAKARGAKIYAELVGAGASADAYHLTAPHPEGLGAEKVMLYALDDAHINPEDIDYINTHGTSTPLGDISETTAIKKVFGDHAYKLNISSTKSMTGHLLGAAGAIEAIASTLAIAHQAVPPTINFSIPDERLDQKLNFTFGETQEREIRYALSNTFGFGGHNASIILKKFEG